MSIELVKLAADYLVEQQRLNMIKEAIQRPAFLWRAIRRSGMAPGVRNFLANPLGRSGTNYLLDTSMNDPTISNTMLTGKPATAEMFNRVIENNPRDPIFRGMSLGEKVLLGNQATAQFNQTRGV